MSFDNLFGTFRFIFIAVSILAVGVIIAVIVITVRRKRLNDRSPILTVDAVITAKHKDTTYHRHPIAGDISGGHGYHTIPSIRYTVVFRTDDNASLRLSVDETTYDYLHEGDAGRLTYQGDRFLRFDNN